MPEPPTARLPRRDDTAADARSLEQMGRLEPQPIPAPSVQPFQEPEYLDGSWTDGTDEPA